MGAYSFAHLDALLSKGDVNIVEVGVFWREARLVRPPTAEHALIGVPATLHLAGKLSSVVYAEMPVATGSRVRSRETQAALAWISNRFRERRRAGLLRFGLPDFGLFWRGETEDASAVSLAGRFAQVLAEEFPDPQAELGRQFHMDMSRLVAYLSEIPFLRAGTTQPDRSR